MLTHQQSERVEIILVSPRNPLNIGAAARAMANFGLRRLTIVAPFATNWTDAKSAVGAPDLLRDARVLDTLAEAVADCGLVLGTGSLDRRRPDQAILDMPAAAAEMHRVLSTSVESAHAKQPRVALVFGSEKHGLTSDDLTWCHAIAVIDTTEDQPSMNLGQSVAVCLYELSRNPGSLAAVPHYQSAATTLLPAEATEALPDSSQLDRLAELIEDVMEESNYLTRGLRSANGEALRILLRRLMPRDSDLRRMMGLFRRILWQLRHLNARQQREL